MLFFAIFRLVKHDYNNIDSKNVVFTSSSIQGIWRTSILDWFINCKWYTLLTFEPVKSPLNDYLIWFHV